MAKALSWFVNLLCSCNQYLPNRLSMALDRLLVPLAEAFCIGKDRDEPLF